MKNFRWVVIGVSLLFLSMQATRASDNFDEQVVDSKELGRLQKKLEHFQIPLSALQLLLIENPFNAGKKTVGPQYLALKEARGFKGCLYFFSVLVDHQNPDPENYRIYFQTLGNPKYQEKMISPLTMRVLGAYGHEEKDYYQGTYVFRHEKLPPFKFHILAIEEKKAQKLEQGVAFYILSGNSKKDSVQLSTLCKEEYEITKEGKFIKKGDNSHKDSTVRWFSLEELIGEKVPTQEAKPKVSTPKREVFKRQLNKKSGPVASSSQPSEPESPLSQGKSARSSSFSSAAIKPISPSSSKIEKKSVPSTSERGRNFSLLDEEAKALLSSFREHEATNKGDLEESLPSPSSSVQMGASTQEVPIASSSSQPVATVRSGGNTSSTSTRREQNRAFLDLSARDLLKKK